MHKVKYYTHLSKEERAQIEVLLKAGHSRCSIARALGRSVSTICREVKRNSTPQHYQAESAQLKTAKRHQQKRKRVLFGEEMKRFIQRKLKEERLSPELICVMGRKSTENFVSHEWIYRWIWRVKFSKAATDRPYQELYQYLRHCRRRKRRGNRHSKRGNILQRRWIDERPKSVEKRKRVGDLEVDTVLGRERRAGLLVAVDRRTRKVWIEKIRTKQAGHVTQKLKGMVQKAGGVKTITFDNDQSFAEHYRLHHWGIRTFFTHPFSSQEKGSVENRIGLIRMFFPKGTDFAQVSVAEVRKVEKLLNNRPMRMFGYKTPNEMHQKLQPLH